MDDLARAVYRQTDDHPNGELVARSEGVTLLGADTWRDLAAVCLRPDEPETDAPLSIDQHGVFRLPNGAYLVAQAQWADGPRTLYTTVPAALMRAGNVDLSPLMVTPQQPDTVLAKWPLETVLKASQALNRTALLEAMHEAGRWDILLMWLDAALSDEQLLISGHDEPTRARMQIVRALMALLPAVMRADLTYSTHGSAGMSPAGRVVFSNAAPNGRYVYDWQAADWTDEAPPRHDYVAYLEAHTDSPDALFAAIDRLTPLLVNISRTSDLVPQLADVTWRYQLHERIVNAETANVDDLIDGLQSGKLPDAWLQRYTTLLLPLALEKRDTALYDLLKHEMDSHATLHAALSPLIDAALDDTPDLVYAFMRYIAANTDDLSETWRAWLYRAGEQALAVALEDGTPDVVLSWLKLLAREPESFGLAPLLTRGFSEAAPLSYENGDFGRDLLVLAARFFIAIVDALLADTALMDALPDDICAAFADPTAESLDAVLQLSTNLFLVAVNKAAHAQAVDGFDEALITQLWELHNDGKRYNTRQRYTPNDTLTLLTTESATWLPDAARETLFALVMTHRDSGYFAPFASHLANNDLLSPTLIGALMQLPVNANTALDTVSILTAAERLTPSDAMHIYFDLLTQWEWSADGEPLVEPLARILAQNHDLTPTNEQLVPLLAMAVKQKQPVSAKVTALRLMDIAAQQQTDVVAQLIAILGQLNGLPAARAAVIAWWQDWLNTQPISALERYTEALGAVRGIEGARAVLVSTLAVRRFVDTVGVEAFPESIKITYNTLEAFVEAFNGEGDTAPSLDPSATAEALAPLFGPLTTQQRQILSHALLGIATMLTTISESRSRPGLGRSIEKFERQLMQGETPPQGTIDIMMLMAGLLTRRDNDPTE